MRPFNPYFYRIARNSQPHANDNLMMSASGADGLLTSPTALWHPGMPVPDVPLAEHWFLSVDEGQEPLVIVQNPRSAEDGAPNIMIAAPTYEGPAFLLGPSNDAPSEEAPASPVSSPPAASSSSRFTLPAALTFGKSSERFRVVTFRVQ